MVCENWESAAGPAGTVGAGAKIYAVDPPQRQTWPRPVAAVCKVNRPGRHRHYAENALFASEMWLIRTELPALGVSQQAGERLANGSWCSGVVFICTTIIQISCLRVMSVRTPKKARPSACCRESAAAATGGWAAASMRTSVSRTGRCDLYKGLVALPT